VLQKVTDETQKGKISAFPNLDQLAVYPLGLNFVECNSFYQFFCGSLELVDFQFRITSEPLNWNFRNLKSSSGLIWSRTSTCPKRTCHDEEKTESTNRDGSLQFLRTLELQKLWDFRKLWKFRTLELETLENLKFWNFRYSILIQ
jgi:hypothetical protein